MELRCENVPFTRFIHIGGSVNEAVYVNVGEGCLIPLVIQTRVNAAGAIRECKRTYQHVQVWHLRGVGNVLSCDIQMVSRVYTLDTVVLCVCEKEMLKMWVIDGK